MGDLLEQFKSGLRGITGPSALPASDKSLYGDVPINDKSGFPAEHPSEPLPGQFINHYTPYQKYWYGSMDDNRPMAPSDAVDDMGARTSAQNSLNAWEMMNHMQPSFGAFSPQSGMSGIKRK